MVAWDSKFALGATKGSVIRMFANNTYMLFVALIPGPIVTYLVMRYGGGRDEGHLLLVGWSGYFRVWFIEEGSWDKEWLFNMIEALPPLCKTQFNEVKNFGMKGMHC